MGGCPASHVWLLYRPVFWGAHDSNMQESLTKCLSNNLKDLLWVTSEFWMCHGDCSGYADTEWCVLSRLARSQLLYDDVCVCACMSCTHTHDSLCTNVCRCNDSYIIYISIYIYTYVYTIYINIYIYHTYKQYICIYILYIIHQKIVIIWVPSFFWCFVSTFMAKGLSRWRVELDLYYTYVV